MLQMSVIGQRAGGGAFSNMGLAARGGWTTYKGISVSVQSFGYLLFKIPKKHNYISLSFFVVVVLDMYYYSRSRNYFLAHTALRKKETGNCVSHDPYNATIQHLLTA